VVLVIVLADYDNVCLISGTILVEVVELPVSPRDVVKTPRNTKISLSCTSLFSSYAEHSQEK
jgi:hypothetical protein